MSCKHIQQKLDLYAGDDLDGREAAEVAAHLKSCLACYRDYADLHALLGQVRATARDVVGGARGGREADDFVASVMGEIHGPPPPAPQLVPRLAMVSGWAAALLLGLSLGWRTLQSSRPGPAEANEPRVIKHGDGSIAFPVGDSELHSVGLEAEFARQLDELRRRSPSRSPQVVPATAIKTKSF